MPQCHRCGRVQATAELRRTTLGYVCRENGKGTRCDEIARELRAQLRVIHVGAPGAPAFQNGWGNA